jgi:Glycosyltransferase sugar-binding region containing DXD motif/Alpha 1,4-glycosyltransferase conserved region
MEQLSIRSFLVHGHEYHLYVFEDVQNVPTGVVLKDGTEFFSADRIFTYKQHESFSAFSNLFRYKLLQERGGYWVDTDVVCLKPFHFESDYIFAQEELTEDKRRIGSNVIRTPAKSEIIEYCLNISAAKNPESLHWGEIGPDLMTEAVSKFRLDQYVQSYTIFNPINWWHWQDFIRDDIKTQFRLKRKLRKECHAIHLWHEMWRRNGIDKNQTYPRKSLYERLKRQYL